jgi:glycosyltransferase involved in cell wall biosynthesis
MRASSSPDALALVLPGDPETPTGGYEYDRRIVAGLRERGWEVSVHALAASFPAPDAAALVHARDTFARIPDGRTVVVDGLALGALPDLAAAEARRLRLVALVHHPLAAETGLAPERAEALCRSEARALAAVRIAVAPSVATARALADYGVPAERIVVVEPGTDPAALADGSGGPTVELLCVAAVVPRKGHEVLIEALGSLATRRWHLTCAGSLARSPETVARLRHRLDELRLAERVRLAGVLDPPALEASYARADAFVLATLHEGYGMALAEALARGLPVVSTAAGAVPEVVPADAGLLVPPGNVTALRDALARVLDDAALRGSLAAGARRARERLPTWDMACARFEDALGRARSNGDGLHR